MTEDRKQQISALADKIKQLNNEVAKLEEQRKKLLDEDNFEGRYFAGKNTTYKVERRIIGILGVKYYYATVNHCMLLDKAIVIQLKTMSQNEFYHLDEITESQYIDINKDFKQKIHDTRND